TEVTSAVWDDGRQRWTLTTAAGGRLSARFCVMAVGCLSRVLRPTIPGLDTFSGEWYHTAEWPAGGVDLAGRRVAVVGTGSTGIQTVTAIAPVVAELYVLQRTPNYSMPAQNRPLGPAELAEAVAGFAERRRRCERSDAGVPTPAPTMKAFDVDDEERRAMYEAGWRRGSINALSYAFTDYFTDEDANRTAQEFAREKISQLVADPAVAALLSPRHDIGTKRTCVDTGYYQTFNRPNVHLLDAATSPVRAITPAGVATDDACYEVDVIVFATGFDAMTGALRAIDIRGTGGASLRDRWAEGPRTYLGLAVAGFPNLFAVTGPGSPSVLSNMVVSIEQHVDWIADCLAYLDGHGYGTIEATPEAEEAWVGHVEALGRATLYPRARSWYVGANVAGKPRVFMPYVGGCGRYRAECDAVVAAGYRGFRLLPEPAALRRGA
ncbi:MAG: flavin-containing monooxygenase, partial [Acidimicrobiales bacterium]